MKKRVTVSSLRHGQTIHVVHALGEKASFAAAYYVLGRPYMRENIGLGLRVERVKCTFRYRSPKPIQIFLDDCGITNDRHDSGHRTFYSRKKAESFLKRCRDEDIGGPGYRERSARLAPLEITCDISASPAFGMSYAALSIHSAAAVGVIGVTGL